MKVDRDIFRRDDGNPQGSRHVAGAGVSVVSNTQRRYDNHNALSVLAKDSITSRWHTEFEKPTVLHPNSQQSTNVTFKQRHCWSD